jgi:hypothetical protein
MAWRTVQRSGQPSWRILPLAERHGMPASVSIKCPYRGSSYGGGEPVMSSSEAGPHPRGDRPSSEAEPHPRGDQPSSEAGPHPRGRPALERGGGLLVRCRAPRAKRSSARGWLGRLSDGPLGPPGPWAREFILSVF